MPQVQRFGTDADFEQTIRRAPAKLRDGTPVEIEYVIEIDWVRMRDLAERAARNKGRRAKFGPVTAWVAGVKRGAA